MFLHLFLEMKKDAKNGMVVDDQNFKVSDLNHCSFLDIIMK